MFNLKALFGCICVLFAIQLTNAQVDEIYEAVCRQNITELKRLIAEGASVSDSIASVEYIRYNWNGLSDSIRNEMLDILLSNGLPYKYGENYNDDILINRISSYNSYSDIGEIEIMLKYYPSLDFSRIDVDFRITEYSKRNILPLLYQNGYIPSVLDMSNIIEAYCLEVHYGGYYNILDESTLILYEDVLRKNIGSSAYKRRAIALLTPYVENIPKIGIEKSSYIITMLSNAGYNMSIFNNLPFNEAIQTIVKALYKNDEKSLAYRTIQGLIDFLIVMKSKNVDLKSAFTHPDIDEIYNNPFQTLIQCILDELKDMGLEHLAYERFCYTKEYNTKYNNVIKHISSFMPLYQQFKNIGISFDSKIDTENYRYHLAEHQYISIKKLLPFIINGNLDSIELLPIKEDIPNDSIIFVDATIFSYGECKSLYTRYDNYISTETFNEIEAYFREDIDGISKKAKEDILSNAAKERPWY